MTWCKGTKWCDFFGSTSSCVDALRAEFRESRKRNKSLRLTKSTSQRSSRLKTDKAALDAALGVVQNASYPLTSESVRLFETADAHVYLGWHLYLDGFVEKAIVKTQPAIQVDLIFGNPYNDLGLIRVKEGKNDEAHHFFQKAKGASRHYACHKSCCVVLGRESCDDGAARVY
ncbi:putative tetratricopeptide-like helical domain superfamily [Plasmopara halstedii]